MRSSPEYALGMGVGYLVKTRAITDGLAGADRDISQPRPSPPPIGAVLSVACWHCLTRLNGADDTGDRERSVSD
jgi:hypothetical protein